MMEAASLTLPAESLAALTDAVSALNSTLQLDAVLQTIARSACTVIHAEAASVFLLDARHAKLVAVAAAGRRRDALLGRNFDKTTGIPGEVVRVGQPVNIPDVRATRKYAKQIDDIGVLGTRSIVAAPMLHRSEVVGVIEVVNRWDEQAFTKEDVALLQLFATLAAVAMQNARAFEELQRRFAALRDSVVKGTPIIGDSTQFKAVLELSRRVAPSAATVLITGESGTGKELAARFIHANSRRRDGAFIAVNCAALTETLLESELFGHEKGAFTGAGTQHLGWFETANQGTLFLDEIGEISKSTQAKLLRVLQEREFIRVGGNKPIPCDVRIIAATNRDLKSMMGRGEFREDLFYRLCVFPLTIPPLRERVADIPTLIRHFVARMAQNVGCPEPFLSPETLTVLCRYSWPGNIRELQNVLERAVLLCEDGVLAPTHLPPDLLDRMIIPERAIEDSPFHAQERTLILKALQESNWNQSEAARQLGISRDLLRHRLKKYQIRRPGDPEVAQ